MGKNKIYVQISAGRGPAECCWVVAQVLKEMIKFITHHQLSYSIVDRQEGSENRTVSSVLLLVEGKNVSKMMKEWEGTIQWIGKSMFRVYHKRKNWFVGVSLFEELEATSFRELDVEFQTFRSSGPGGQHRNKVETAVRATHKPTGLSVSSTDSKSQIQNKKASVLKLKETIAKDAVVQMQRRLDEQWKENLSLERGNPVKVFEGRGFISKPL